MREEQLIPPATSSIGCRTVFSGGWQIGELFGHVIPLGVRMVDPSPLRDARNVFCRALMDMGDEFYSAETEAKDAVRKPGSSMVINSVKRVGAGADGKRFRAVAVDVGRNRVVAVVPAAQREISIELSDL